MSAESKYQTIAIEGRGPERLSAIHRQMIDELEACLDGAERDADIRDGLKVALAWRNDRFGS